MTGPILLLVKIRITAQTQYINNIVINIIVGTDNVHRVYECFVNYLFNGYYQSIIITLGHQFLIYITKT